MEKFRKIFAYPPSISNFLLEKLVFTVPASFWGLVGHMQGVGAMPKITAHQAEYTTAVDAFWSQETVYVPQFQSAIQSWLNLQWRFRIHPKFKELTGLYGPHEGEVILDYGCGPGNDMVGFTLYTNARKVIGMDVSLKSLALAAYRLALHKVDTQRVELIQSHDAEPEIQLSDESIDFISCQGVLMHTSHPEKILAEFFRVLKGGAQACVMVYTRPSVWFDLYTAYERVIVKGAFPGLDIDQAFSKNTDGVDCPLARCYPVNQFISLCESAGFECRFAGGYLTETEIISTKQHLASALNDLKLADSHKEFLNRLTFDDKKLPMCEGYYAGVSGVYHLRKV